MNKKTIILTTSTAGQYQVEVNQKPGAEEIKSVLQSLLKNEVKKILISMPAALGAEFMFVQTLSLLRRNGKEISIQWTDHSPSGSTLSIIQSLIQ